MDLTKMGLIQLQNPCHPTGLLHKANQMRLAGTLCDVVIMVDSQEFHAHRTVLACTSKMFEILFHRNSQHYTLDFLSPKTFQQILEYAYTATLQAKVEDLDDLLYAAEILEIEYLEEQCLKILETIQASEDNDTEVAMADGGATTTAEEEEERKSRYIKGLFISKPTGEEGGYAGMASQSLPAATVEQSPSASASYCSLSSMSPTKAAVDSLMTIGQSLLQGALPPSVPEDSRSATTRRPSSLAEVKTEAMQVDEASSHDSPRTAEPGASSGEKPDEKGKEGPGTPTRSSVITSARELHYTREEGAEPPPDPGQGLPLGPEPSAAAPGEKPLGIYSLLPNHKTEPVLGVPPTVASALHVQPALAVSMDFSAYGGLLPQGFIQRELFSKLGELAAGMKTESRALGEQCSVCGAELPDNETLEQHRKLHSGMKTYGCELCGKRFLDSLRLRMHLLAHSGTDMAVFCLLCGKRFQTQSALQQHMEVHAGVRSYICSECNRTFPSHTALKRHLRSHTGDHPYECEFCGSCFRDESTLKGHKRIHTGEKPYECNGCGKKFSLKHQLETHYRVHTGEKPFECKLCHQRSRDYSAMIKHLRTHNGASPYQCTICLEYCPSLSAMQKHMKGHKPEEIPTDWRIEKTYLYLCYV
ncbi:zinc finger and BTB domain-containing protein 16 isoform X2 [Poecile atricapillus]|uniref:zinc finger and BTB domain-containing protein 16 isoform X2 n=1 Tax=Poecile atricapillus TaxID=48891 RepID=UPI00273875FF|nr:zinc finger and BTB domain-containing protein 16 isoform X2 [Poecile atricapillus]